MKNMNNNYHKIIYLIIIVVIIYFFGCFVRGTSVKTQAAITNFKIKEHYNTVYDYWIDMKKIQQSYNSYSIKGNMSSPLMGDITFNCYKKYRDYLIKLKNSNSNGLNSGFFKLPKNFLYKSGENYIYGFDTNPYIAVKPPLELISKNGQITIKYDTFSEPDIFPYIFDWYTNLYNQKSTPVFEKEKTYYNGIECRLINFGKKEETKQYGSKKLTDSVETKACISDKYGIAIFVNKTLFSENFSGKYDKAVENFKVLEIRTNSVSDFDLSLNNLPSKIIDKNSNISFEEFEKLLNLY